MSLVPSCGRCHNLQAADTSAIDASSCNFMISDGREAFSTVYNDASESKYNPCTLGMHCSSTHTVAGALSSLHACWPMAALKRSMEGSPMHVWSTQKFPATFSALGSLLSFCTLL
jgi:hypothetical protein